MTTQFHDPAWIARSVRLREIAAELADMATHFNLERESCKCGESHRWKDMNQWQLHDRITGLVERMTKLGETIERRAHEFIPKEHA
jgi:hypothetical protein